MSNIYESAFVKYNTVCTAQVCGYDRHVPKILSFKVEINEFHTQFV